MKKRYILLALLMTSTAAHAGNSVSFEINGHRVHIEAPKNCDSLSCLQISAPGLSASDFGFKTGKSAGIRDDDDVAPRSEPPAQNQPRAGDRRPPLRRRASPPAPTALASTGAHPVGQRRCGAGGAGRSFATEPAAPSPPRRFRRRRRRSASGPRKKTREWFASNNAARIFADMP